MEKGLVPKNEFEVERAKILSQIPIHDVILDCSCVNFIDLMGVNGLIQVILINFIIYLIVYMVLFVISFD